MKDKFHSIAAASLLGVCMVPVLGTANAQSSDESSVRWRTVIGIIMPGNVVGSGAGAVIGGGQPWSTLEGDARVNLQTGEVSFDVQGLVLAGGNNIGVPGAVNQVLGTLVCDTDGSAGGGNSVVVNTPAVPLSELGDAMFSGVVPLPGVCSQEPDIAFLVRNAPSGIAGNWIANGAVRRNKAHEQLGRLKLDMAPGDR